MQFSSSILGARTPPPPPPPPTGEGRTHLQSDPVPSNKWNLKKNTGKLRLVNRPNIWKNNPENPQNRLEKIAKNEMTKYEKE